MKKFILFFFCLFFIHTNVWADSLSGLSSGSTVFVNQTITLTDNAASVDLNNMLAGGYLYAIEIFSVGDDVVTFTINSELGTALYTTTTTAANSGEIENPTGYWPIVNGSLPNYTLTGFTGTSITIVVTVVKK